MKRTKVAVVIGTRPEAIKMAPVVIALEQSPRFEPCVILTGQHRELLDQVVDFFGIQAHHDLALMKPGQSLHELTGRVLVGLSAVFEEEKPDLVLVHGDTTTCFAGALASFYARIPVGHVEAGLRTGDLLSPFPEELNRKLTGTMAALHFAPTQRARENLLAEGVDSSTIHVTGNTVIDALHIGLERLEGHQSEHLSSIERVLAQRPDADTLLVTAHRRENFGEGFEHICSALADLARARPNLHVVFPVHLNPRVREPVFRHLDSIDNVSLVEPLSYEAFIHVMSRCDVVLTDSGGIQEEAPGLGKPVLVLRDVTERPEAVDAGTVLLVGTDRARIVSEVSRLLDDRDHYRRMSEVQNPYGDGAAAQRIIEALTLTSET